MNHYVPEFETVEDYLIPKLAKKSTMGGDEDIMELLWQNGQVVAQSQNQRSVGNRKVRSSVVEDETTSSDLFMQEDEMSSWLHYPIDDNSLDRYLYSNDLLYPTPLTTADVTTASCSLSPPPPPSVPAATPRPPVPPIRRVDVEPGLTKCTSFLHFSRPGKARASESPVVKRSMVESNETPVVADALEPRATRVSDTAAIVSAEKVDCGVGAVVVGREVETCELSVTSSPGTGGSGGSGSAEAPAAQRPPPASDDRKRKGRNAEENECRSEDVEFQYPPDAKKQSHGSTSTKRSRAAEVHNLSERKRRDRINEKMKALQELIPRCNKSDKASMLDEAIEYLKSLQLQVQMMSMGCSMVPMMFPGVQQYMPPMAIGMGMGMGMDRAMVPYPAILPGSTLPNPAAAQLGQRFPVPGFNMPPVTVTGPAASQPANLSAPMMTSFPLHNPNQPRVPNFADPYQQYLGLHQTQVLLPQNQTGTPPISTKPSSSKDDHHQTG